MAKKAYIGVDGKARKIKKGYVGVDGKARKIKKAYIGIGGVARPCWSGGELEYYGTITGLSRGEADKIRANTSNHAVFISGEYSYGNSSQGYAYDKSLVQTKFSCPNMTHDGDGTSLGGYAIYFGDTYDTDRAIYVYDDSLTLVSSSLRLSSNRSFGVAASVGNYALYAGGNAVTSSVDAVDTSLTKTMAPSMVAARYTHCGGSIGKTYALFGGGRSRASSGSGAVMLTSVDVYDASLTRTAAGALSFGGQNMSGTSSDERVIFAGGSEAENAIWHANVQVYGKSLTLTNATPLSVTRRWMSATSVEGISLFVGGQSTTSFSGVNNVESYDESLTRKTEQSLSEGKYEVTCATIGNYALCVGGRTSNGSVSDTGVKTVEAYVVA